MDVQFVLLGPDEPGNPDAVQPSLLEGIARDNVVRWLPFREDTATVYAASSVVVVPSYYAEGTPKTVMEGMAMGLPVVCSDLPSTRQLVEHMRDAVLVRPRDVTDLADAVTQLLQSPVRCRALGKEARRTAVARFDANRVARSAVATVYGSLFGRQLEEARSR
jgi:glycosyltransferase involved in cell wall biosynthesis